MRRCSPALIPHTHTCVGCLLQGVLSAKAWADRRREGNRGATSLQGANYGTRQRAERAHNLCSGQSRGSGGVCRAGGAGLAGEIQAEGWFGAQFCLAPSLQHHHVGPKSWEEGVPSCCGCSRTLQHLGALLGNARVAAASSQQSWSSPKHGEPGQKHLLSLKSRERLQSFEQQPVRHGAAASSLLPSWENPEQTLPMCWNRPGPPLQNRNGAIVKHSLSRTLSFFPSQSENSLEMFEFFSNGKACFSRDFFFLFLFFSRFQTKPSLSGLCLSLPSAGSLLWPCPEHLGPPAAVGSVSHPSECSGAPLPFLLPPSLVQMLPLCVRVAISGGLGKPLAQENGQCQCPCCILHAGMLLAGAGSTSFSLGADATERWALLVQIPSSKQRDQLGKLQSLWIPS